MLNEWSDREPPRDPKRQRRWFLLLCALGALSLLAPLAARLLR